MILSILPVHQRVILAPIVLYLEHSDTRNIPLEVELDQSCWRSGLSRHHPLINPAFHVACHVAAVGSAAGRRGNVRGSGVRFLDVVGVVGDVREFYDNQIYFLVGFAGRVGGDAAEGAGVFHSTDEDVQGPIGVDQSSGGVRHQFALWRDPVDGRFWVTSCLTPLRKSSRVELMRNKTEWGQMYRKSRTLMGGSGKFLHFPSWSYSIVGRKTVWYLLFDICFVKRAHNRCRMCFRWQMILYVEIHCLLNNEQVNYHVDIWWHSVLFFLMCPMAFCSFMF